MLQNVTLEMSLKPFRKTDDSSIDAVCRKVFEQWKPLVRDVPCVSVMLWSADGSELLDYRGDLDAPFSYAKYIGGANNREGSHAAIDPDNLGLHSRCYLFCEDPPEMTYRILRQVVSSLKRIGKEVLGETRTIRVGTTFDPGPEFAKSSFKYSRHNEICMGNDMGRATMVCSYARLNGDDTSYAAFPEGIPDGLPFGTFFGAQSEKFLSDMGFDYIWFSNGLGFGRETWAATGAIFDGEQFHGDKLVGVRQDVVDFWQYFRKECPAYPIETRGTNMSMGIDFATDGVPLRTIYDGGYDLLPPPNSPWAAINGDFGLELMGHMSRIAGLPNENEDIRHPYLFRFYIHDIWWANSPWYDRYNSQPHDIYLPMSVARIDSCGKIESPTHLSLLSIDNCFGDMPDACADEPIPHLRRAVKEAPDDVAPVVWVYPFDEYSAASDDQELMDMYAGDWWIRGAINDGAPVSMVVSTTNFCQHDLSMYKNSILVTPVPKASSPFEERILAYASTGGKVVFYGNTLRASAAFLDLFGLRNTADTAEGELPLTIDGADAGMCKVVPIVSGGALATEACDGCAVWAEAGGKVLAAQKDCAVWLRGIVGSEYRKGARQPSPQDSTKYCPGETFLRLALERLGVQIRMDKRDGVKSPVIMTHRHDNAVMFSVYSPSTTVKTKIRYPWGAPVLDGYETILEDGFATYHFPKAEHRECRVFVEQAEGIVGCQEIPPVSAQYRRRVEVTGLVNATVRFFGEAYCKNNLQVLRNSHRDNYFIGDPFTGEYITDGNLTWYEVKNVTGRMTFSMPFPEDKLPPQEIPPEEY
ncbi:MAG: hypothetical protein IKY52_00940 [Clostridia bacterium]|nr:hypothetical protein [Clostridia bacterium]